MKLGNLNSKYGIVLIAAAFGLLFWLIQVALDLLIIGEKSLLDLLILNVSRKEIYDRISVFANFLFFGILMLAVFAKFRRIKDSFKEDEKSYRDLLSGAFDSVLIHENGFILDANTQLETMTGYSLSEVLGKSVLDLVNDESREIILEAMKSNRSEPIEVVIKAKDGRHIWIEAIGEKINYRGRKARIVAIRDISERKLAEKELRDSRARYEELFNSALDGFGLVDQNEIIQFCNPAFAKIFDVDDESTMIGENITDFIPSNQKDFFLFQTQIRKGGEPSRYELEILTRKNITKHVLVSASPRFDENGKYIGAFGDVMDITARKQAEESRKEKDEFFRALCENSPIGICLIDEDGIYRYVNSTYCRIYGYTKEEMLDKTFYEILKRPGNPKNREEEFRKQFATGEVIPFGELEFLNASGETVCVQYTADFVKENDRIKYMVAMNTDITEQKKLEAQLLQSQKMESIGRLAGGVAHDFNNLLTVILGHVELINTAVKPEDPISNDIREIQAASERAAGLTKQLLAFSRKQPLALKIINLNHVIDNMKNLLHRIIGEDIDLRAITPDDLWNVKADRGLIEQVITNLAVNARDAMPRGGVLTIETKNVELDFEFVRTHSELEPGGYIKLSVSDTGCGISEELKGKIFEPFFTTKEIGKGTGLGLSTVYGIIKQSGGHISVYSEENQGTIFNIFLPVAEGEAEAIKSESEPAESLRGNETILVVEDDENIRNLITKVLRHYGYDIIIADNPKEALLKSKQIEKPIDLIITDMVMPDMGGTELTEKLHELWPGLKTLYISGYTGEFIIRQNKIDHTVPFLQKPFRATALVHSIRDILDNR